MQLGDVMRFRFAHDGLRVETQVSSIVGSDEEAGPASVRLDVQILYADGNAGILSEPRRVQVLRSGLVVDAVHGQAVEVPWFVREVALRAALQALGSDAWPVLGELS